ncbi:MAG: D-alanine--D-alanine ligase [Atribacterota bacterium]|jgi:D-alanine-D-alanine ligase|nr:D-alanine--D-alanine ligase [Atribacterota bacterium]MDD4895875.1 D-alanine--D-alanine ligase [Atribacterota bacterium]MDD5637646.1 D-alanine--D-alanine ligase [Atribacterota bacterium]
MKQQKKIKVGILFGGKSGEHEVSFCSASSVIKAINPEKYKAIPIGITKNGYWLSPEDSCRALLTGRIEGKEIICWESKTDEHQFIIINKKNNEINYSFLEKLDVIFPVLHGPYGEDGTIQGLLELIDIPYVGSGVVASSLSMDKELMKKIFQQAGLPHTRWIMIKRKRWSSEPEKILTEIEKELCFPLFVKPTNLGSSVGISKVEKRDELASAINLATAYDRKIIIEEGVEDNIEVECSVLGNDEPEVSVVGEVKPAGKYYDYDSKYIDENTQLIIPAGIPNKIAKQIQDISKLAFLAIDAAGFARVDFLVQKRKNSYQIYLNEINTIPGFTQASMYPKLWEKSGIGFRELIDKLIQLALERYQDKLSNKIDYPSKLLEK